MPRNQTEIPIFSGFEQLLVPDEARGERKLNIGLDIDGVKFPYHKPYEEMYAGHHCHIRNKPLRNFMHSLSETAIAQLLGLDRGDMFRSKDDFLNSPEAQNILPISGSVEGVGLLAEVHNVWDITSRTEDVRESTEEWLDRYYEMDKINGLIMLGDNSGSQYAGKGKVFKELELDVHVDDMPKHIREAKQAGVKNRIMFGRYPWNTPNRAPGSHRARNWLEVVGLVNQAFLRVHGYHEPLVKHSKLLLP